MLYADALRIISDILRMFDNYYIFPHSITGRSRCNTKSVVIIAMYIEPPPPPPFFPVTISFRGFGINYST